MQKQNQLPEGQGKADEGRLGEKKGRTDEVREDRKRQSDRAIGFGKK